MLPSTFIFLQGIGESTERFLWDSGIINWETFLQRGTIPRISASRKTLYDTNLEEAKAQWNQQNSRYFGKILKARDHWRLYPHYRANTAFLDIETNGIPSPNGEITVVGIYGRGQMTTLVQGETLSEHRLQKELASYDLLVTFFGSGFDVPFLKTAYPNLILDHPHLDLCFAARRLGFKGGLKSIEHELGCYRTTSIEGLTGWDAVRLWEEWQGGNIGSRNLLLEYNEADCENLEMLADLICDRDGTGIWPASTGIYLIMSTLQSPTWIGTGLTDIGRVRKINQDAFAVDNEHQLWVLADGMGGHAGGEIASQIAVETIPDYFKSHREGRTSIPLPATTLETLLVQAIESANRRIREQASQHSEIQGMGTTVVAIAMTHTANHSQAVVAHTGDSRAYVFRNKILTLWTKDHTLMEERLALNLITPEQIHTHPLRHVLTKALGIDPQAMPTVQTFTLKPSDLLLLCSDGLTKMLTDPEIQSLMLKETPNVEQTTHTLVNTANRLGGEDNTTVIVIGADSDATILDLPSATE